jgi:hypothetical protein
MTGWRKRQIKECEMTDREAMAMALEALETLMIERGSIYEKAITTLKERLTQPEQEPACPECKATVLYECVACSSKNYPPQRTWVDLTDTRIEQVYFEMVKEHRGAPMPWGQVQFGRALLEKFKEVNQ